ncbi:caspase family protein [Delftia tsuruhatensis]|uniref:caspase family protein n=1 Tax=Delftia tsuruhatensis TaxID=180282 RepID=UPI00036630E4|nr:caspase family protein [Delftia tsuruhatensis]MDH0849475.1 caspase family protein [Delftia tsuruhatensis]
MTTPGYPQGRALLVGVSEYQRISSLPDAIQNDVKDVAATLSSPTYCGYSQENVVSLLNADATRNAVLEGLSDLAARAVEDDTVCVYFSGHGTVFESPDGDDSALLTVDSDLSDVAGTAISSGDLATALGQIKAERVLVFIDSCHAGGTRIAKGLTDDQGHEFKSGYSETAFAKLAVGRGRALMASCRADEESSVILGARNSVFTTALLVGLRGAAEKDGSGVIKVFDLFEYVADKVPKSVAGDQHPIFKADNLEQNFPVALSRGGKKSPTGTPAPSKPVDADRWSQLEACLIELFPTGPRDQELWTRAGGDLSKLQLYGPGQATWHSALRTLKQGGGGRSITFDSLLATAREDFPMHAQLQVLGGF